jgi:DNA-binding transcriptional regulator YiaG
VNATELKEWRDHYMLSQSELAEILEVHPMTVSKWERELARIPAMLDLALETLGQRRARLVARLKERRAIRKTQARKRAVA